MTTMYVQFFFFISILIFQKHYHIDELKERLIEDSKRYDTAGSHKRSSKHAYHLDNHIPPYIRKYNRRFKSIYESMHNSDDDMTEQKSKKNVYGYFERYQHNKGHRSTNEIPESDMLNEIMQKSRKHKSKQHHHYSHSRKKHLHHHNSRIKKFRSKPEAGIMQKKRKI